METKVDAIGCRFSGLLTILFIALKLLEKITGSWIWVLAPLWIELALIVFVALVIVVVKK